MRELDPIVATARRFNGTQPQKPTVVDLFAGAGGLSLGLHEAGFETVLALDSWKAAVLTWNANLGQRAEVADLADPIELPACDLVVGGPPCQGFSSAGLRRENDHRTTLVRHFAHIIAARRPRAFVFENVEGFLTYAAGDRVLDLLEPLVEAGYRIHLRKINAGNYGVPQHRKRVIAIGGLGFDQATTVCRQIDQRLAGERISDRLVSIADPDARPIRKGKLRQPTEFGYVVQLAELTESTRRGARGLILPASTRIGAAAESDLLPATGLDMARLGLRPAEVALDGGFFPSGVAEHLPGVRRAFIAGRQSAGSRRTNRRLARYRVGCEGRISHLKRRYGLRRSRLRGHQGARTWVAWAILAYNLDTLAIRGS